MPPEPESDVRLEIGHVLFMDVVGYSKLLIDDQRRLQQELSDIVRGSEAFRGAEAAGQLIRLPVGDGMALVFLNSPEAPVRCAIEIGRELKTRPQLQLRMGIHSGPINEVRDVNDRTNVAGAGINIAQRVMDCGDAGHILLSKRAAEDLAQMRQWEPHLHDLGECTVKHGLSVPVVNFYTDEAGNPELPIKVKMARAEQAAHSPPPTLRRRTVVIGAILTLVFIAAGAFLFLRQLFPAPPGNGIAVLPFQNFSDDKENEFFADGIQDDILTSLAQIQGLRVISRSSVMGYRAPNQSHNLRSISRELNVANVLEGSVRREGNRVVVNVQLIDAAHDRHLWAKRFDRTLEDSLGLQGELAGEIADALRVTLTADQRARFEKKPTANPEAYVVLLRANHIERNPDTLLKDYKTAQQLYLQAITIDPQFALAHARLASTCAQIFHYYEPLEVWKNQARQEAETALRLQPDLAEAHLALGQYFYWIDADYPSALREFDNAAQLSPNNTEVGGLTAALERRQGHWQKSRETYERIQALDPQNPNIARNLVFTYTAMRLWPEASRLAERMRAMAPTSLVAKIQSGYIDFWWKGDTRLLKSLLEQVPPGTDPDGVVTASRWDLAMLERDLAAARRVMASSTVNEVSYTNGGSTPKNFLLGCIDLAQNDSANAQKYFELARPSFEAAVKEAPASADRHANLGWLYAFMGRKDEAIREGRRAVELKPESSDAVDGVIMRCYLALIYARVGEKDLAFPLLEHLLKTPGAVDSVDYSITVNDLKSRWEWDPIRDDPRFAKLLEDQ